MRTTAVQSHRTPAWRRWMAGGLLLLFLVIQGVGFSAALHQDICCDASAPDHQCAVTLLTHGQVDAPTFVSVSLPAGVEVTPTATAPARVWVPTDHPVEPARGPPVTTV